MMMQKMIKAVTGDVTVVEMCIVALVVIAVCVPFMVWMTMSIADDEINMIGMSSFERYDVYHQK